VTTRELIVAKQTAYVKMVAFLELQILELALLGEPVTEIYELQQKMQDNVRKLSVLITSKGFK
jgi:hypothetical protein